MGCATSTEGGGGNPVSDLVVYPPVSFLLSKGLMKREIDSYSLREKNKYPPDSSNHIHVYMRVC